MWRVCSSSCFVQCGGKIVIVIDRGVLKRSQKTGGRVDLEWGRHHT
jgi:hypothetical protein